MRSGATLLLRGLRDQPDIVVMEGTGSLGGAVVLSLRILGIPYVVSIGDAVGPFLRAKHRALWIPAAIYERLLCRFSAGVIGWSPYLVGRALTFGAPRAMTAANWSPTPLGETVRQHGRQQIRSELGIPPDTIVFGIAGALHWDRRGFCYGYELVQALRRIKRSDVRVLIVGDGSGKKHLEELAGNDLGSRVLLPGRVRRNDVARMLSAMDVGSLPQTLDLVGSVRYTTKISEYLSVGLPVVTGQIPAAYDLDDGWLWRLPGETPWGETYVTALAELMRKITREDVRARSHLIPPEQNLFSGARQQRVASAFVREVLDATAPAPVHRTLG